MWSNKSNNPIEWPGVGFLLKNEKKQEEEEEEAIGHSEGSLPWPIDT